MKILKRGEFVAYIPNSHESTLYPFDIVYSMKSRALLESQAPPQR